jgi:PucR family transcriptional regulator, purine catabolism regulatory protein
MPATTRLMLTEGSLHLSLLHAGDSIDSLIQWVHSSDLADPTPFIEDGQMLLTVGTQFGETAHQDEYDAYVRRLVDRGVVALGFGTEVIRSGTPTELIAACVDAGLTLVEVPYKTPFIAMARWAARVATRESRERDDWALAAQRAISLAAVSQRGLPGVLAVLAQQLDARVAVFSQDGNVDPELSPSDLGDDLEPLAKEASRLLRASNRAASTIELSKGPASLQTLGPRSQLGGVLAIIGAQQDVPTQGVITTAVGLIEISLDQGRIRRGSLMPLHEELLSLLIAGRTDIVLRAVPTLPRQVLRVVLCRVEGHSPWFIEAIERRASAAGSRMFLAPNNGDLVVLVNEDEWKPLAEFLLEQRVSAGVSDATTLTRLGSGLAQARQALARAPRGQSSVTEFSSISGSLFLGFVSSQSMIELAIARLAPLLAEEHGRRILNDTVVWLEHNGVWDSAASELRIHRHSLKKRVETVANALDLSIDKFGDRAQLWSLLYALEFEPGHHFARSSRG